MKPCWWDVEKGSGDYRDVQGPEPAKRSRRTLNGLGAIRRAFPGQRVASTKRWIVDRSWMVARGRFLCDYRTTGGGAAQLRCSRGWFRVGDRASGEDPGSDFRVAANQGFRERLCHHDPQSVVHH